MNVEFPVDCISDVFCRLWVKNRMPYMRGYTGPNVLLGDYYVRELERKGTERRQVVVYEIIGTGRTGQLARTRWERQVRPA